MQTERVTFLTTPDHKAALDAFARNSGMSVGQVVREASSHYISQPVASDEYEQALELALPDIENALAHMSATIDGMRATIADACVAIDRVLAGDPQ